MKEKEMEKRTISRINKGTEDKNTKQRSNHKTSDRKSEQHSRLDLAWGERAKIMGKYHCHKMVGSNYGETREL